MANVNKFFEGYETIRHIAGTLKGLSRAFDLTGNAHMSEELLCLAQDLMGAREKMYEGCFSVKENGPISPLSSVQP